MRRIVFSAVALACTLGALCAVIALATTAPKDGGPLPTAYLDRLELDKTAYRMQHAWIHKVRRVKEAREAYLADAVKRGGPQALADPLPQELVVSGTVAIPVFAGYFQSQSAPYAIGTLRDRLFDDPSGTVTDYYDEVSYGDIVMTGDILGWTQVANVDSYYEGANYGLEPLTDRLGEFMKELLDAHDGDVDFGLYDNDGPDGVPNSGDDDGFVDFVAFVHNEKGAECGGNTNIWSHRWVYRAWNISGGLPYATNDTANGGGFIQVDDYTVQPAISCDGSSVIEIGVFCHEFGHAFGLPDLYDTNGTGNGIGHWGIMGSGNWNQPSSPAHPCAWTREQLGWVTPVEADWTDALASIDAINDNPVAYKLPFTDDRFRRHTACAINGSYSLYCGLTHAEGIARNWVTPGPTGGYGCSWRETIERDFAYNGSGSVMLTYEYAYDIEPPWEATIYDVAHTIIEVLGSETVLTTYHGVGSGTENIDLTPHLAPLSGGGGTYTIKIRFTSDRSFADDDGDHDSSCGAIAIDDVSVTGGGESYSTDFETYADGWHQSTDENPATEYWLVENRRVFGFDQHLHIPGILIMHVDQNVMSSNLGNSGGVSNNQVRGVVVEEANGDFDLNGVGANRGEATDAFPGASVKRSFTSATNPNSNDNTARATRVQVTNISNPAATMTANLRAGDPAPTVASISPIDVDNDQASVQIAVTGAMIRHGATFHFTNPTVSAAGEGVDQLLRADILAASPEWVDPTRLVGTINAYGTQPGTWDLVVTNPDGQSVTLPNALTVNYVITATQLQSASVEVIGESVELRYELHGQEDGEVVRIYRSMRADGGWVLVKDDLRDNGRGVYAYRDDAVEPGKTYYYRLASYLDGEERELHRASATIPALALTLSQNVPNPFNPTTSIHFYLPDRTDVTLEIFDVSGALVRTVAGGRFGAGPHDVQWNGRNNAGNSVGSGVYLYRLTAGKRSLTKKMVLLK